MPQTRTSDLGLPTSVLAYGKHGDLDYQSREKIPESFGLSKGDDLWGDVFSLEILFGLFGEVFVVIYLHEKEICYEIA